MILEWVLFILSAIFGGLVLFGRVKSVKEGESTWVDYARSLFPVVVIVFALRSFIVEPFRIPSGSMLPTLHLGDFILVNKFSYGVRLPIIYTKVFGNGAPERGDVAVFRYPENLKVNYIKRVVGLPGDVLEIRDKRVIINGTPVPITVADRHFDDQVAGGGQNVSRLRETLGEVEHDILVHNRTGARDYQGVVPPGMYFVLGDNRDNSRDSRYWGFVPEQNLVGRAFFIWFNYSGRQGIEWRRIGDTIQ